MGYGWRQVFIGGREKNELAREKMWSRIYLTPLLQAEEDRDQARRHFADLAREKELLGSTTSAYNSDRYVAGQCGRRRRLTSMQIRAADVCHYTWLYDQGLSSRAKCIALGRNWRQETQRTFEDLATSVHISMQTRHTICESHRTQRNSRRGLISRM
jgi:hypothetical protein